MSQRKLGPARETSRFAGGTGFAHPTRISLGQALRYGLMTVEGPRALVRQFATWGLSAFKDVQPAVGDGAAA